MAGSVKRKTGAASGGDDEDANKPNKKRKVPIRKKVAVRKKEVFRLMDLPPELRNKVYKFALTDEQYALTTKKERNKAFLNHDHGRLKIRVPRNKKSFDPKLILTPKIGKFLGLLRVSKKINGEAESIFYGQPLLFDCVVALQKFLLSVKPAALPLLRDITINSIGRVRPRPHNVVHPTVMMLSGATELATLRLSCSFMWDRQYWDRSRFSSFYKRPLAGLDREESVGMGKNFARTVYKWLKPLIDRFIIVHGVNKLRNLVQFDDEFWSVATGMFVGVPAELSAQNMKVMKEAMVPEFTLLHEDRAYRRRLLQV